MVANGDNVTENVPTAVRFSLWGRPDLWNLLWVGFRNCFSAQALSSFSMLAARKADRSALSHVLESLGGEWCVSDTGSGKELQT